MDRLSFLSNKYNVFDNTEEGINSVISFLTDESRLIDTLTSKDNTIFALLSHKSIDSKDGFLSNIKQDIRVDVSLSVFKMMIDSDPTKNKMYTQWIF